MNKQPQHQHQQSDFGDIVATYTRAEALSDGVLVDAGEMAKEAGFRWPVALTVAAWADCVVWHESDNEAQTPQDEAGRLWDVLFMAAHAARRHVRSDEQQLCFQLYRVPRDGHLSEAELVTLKLVIGPGDTGEPVLTLMLPTDD